VTSARHFDTWWKKARAADPGLLTLSPADLVGPAAEEIDPADYPGTWAGLPLSYEFSPGEPGDGVTVDIPLATLNQVSGQEFGWQVPGLREELVTELIRSRPSCPPPTPPARCWPGWARRTVTWCTVTWCTVTCWTRWQQSLAVSVA
jgi:HrpA-like RNA helicase